MFFGFLSASKGGGRVGFRSARYQLGNWRLFWGYLFNPDAYGNQDFAEKHRKSGGGFRFSVSVGSECEGPLGRARLLPSRRGADAGTELVLGGPPGAGLRATKRCLGRTKCGIGVAGRSKLVPQGRAKPVLGGRGNCDEVADAVCCWTDVGLGGRIQLGLLCSGAVRTTLSRWFNQ